MISDTPIGYANGYPIFGLQINEVPAGHCATLRGAVQGAVPLATVVLPTIEELSTCLSISYAIEPELTQKVYADFKEYWARFEAAQAWNAEQEKESGVLSQFVAEDAVYSIVHRAAQKFVYPNVDDDRIFNASFETYIQHKEDGDREPIDQDCFDTLFEATNWIAGKLQERVFKTFMPELTRK